MDYFQTIVLVVSFLAIIISLFAICLAMMFYRLYSQLSLLVTEMSKGLEMSTIRLERIPKLLYNQNLEAAESPQENTISKQQPVETSKQILHADKQDLTESEVI